MKIMINPSSYILEGVRLSFLDEFFIGDPKHITKQFIKYYAYAYLSTIKVGRGFVFRREQSWQPLYSTVAYMLKDKTITPKHTPINLLCHRLSARVGEILDFGKLEDFIFVTLPPNTQFTIHLIGDIIEIRSI